MMVGSPPRDREDRPMLSEWLAVAEHTSISCQGVRSRDRLRPDRPSMMESADSKMSSPLLGPSRSMGVDRAVTGVQPQQAGYA